MNSKNLENEHDPTTPAKKAIKEAGSDEDCGKLPNVKKVFVDKLIHRKERQRENSDAEDMGDEIDEDNIGKEDAEKDSDSESDDEDEVWSKLGQ